LASSLEGALKHIQQKERHGEWTVTAAAQEPVRQLTPSLTQLVKFPAWKMHGGACKKYIFRSYNTSTFSVMPFDENPFTRQCGKEKRKEKRLKGFKFLTFIGRFQVTWK